MAQHDSIGVCIRVGNGVDVTGKTFKPMITLSTDPISEYIEGSLTNKAITYNIFTKLFSNPVRLNSTNDLDNITTAGIYSIESSVPSNAPTGMSNTFACLIVLDTGRAPTQIYIQGGWRGDTKHIAIRGYGGSPAAWSAWRYISDATA